MYLVGTEHHSNAHGTPPILGLEIEIPQVTRSIFSSHGVTLRDLLANGHGYRPQIQQLYRRDLSPAMVKLGEKNLTAFHMRNFIDQGKGFLQKRRGGRKKINIKASEIAGISTGKVSSEVCLTLQLDDASEAMIVKRITRSCLSQIIHRVKT